MKRFSLIVLIICTGCTTLRPIDGNPGELRQRIYSGDLLKPGDRVVIVASDGRAHRFVIKSIDAGLIKGRSESVPIEQMVSLQPRQNDCTGNWNWTRLQRDRSCCLCRHSPFSRLLRLEGAAQMAWSRFHQRILRQKSSTEPGEDIRFRHEISSDTDCGLGPATGRSHHLRPDEQLPFTWPHLPYGGLRAIRSRGLLEWAGRFRTCSGE
jgi:hypothetical protein